MSRILLVEDDERIAATVEDVLSNLNHVVDIASDGPSGLDHLLSSPYELAILDWNLPGMEGFEVCNKFRRSGGTVPILFLTAIKDVSSKVDALDCGADDYLCKPFSLDELLARVNALLRRPAEKENYVIQSGSLKMDVNAGVVKIGEQVVALTAGEYRLLKMFMENAMQIFSVDAILEQLSVAEPESTEAGVRQMIACVRKKLSVDEHHKSLVTIKGSGYYFSPQS